MNLNKRKAITFLKRNKEQFEIEEIIDYFDADTNTVFGDGVYDVKAKINGKWYRLKFVEDIGYARKILMFLSFRKENVSDIVYNNGRYIKLKDGTEVSVDNKYVWVAKQNVNVYDFNLCDGFIYLREDNIYSEQWKRVLKNKKLLIKLDPDVVEKQFLPKIHAKSIFNYLYFITRGMDEFYWETRFIKKGGGVVSDKFHKNIHEILAFMSKFRLDDLNYYIGINPRSEIGKTQKAIKYGNVIFIDMDSRQAIDDIDLIIDRLSDIGLRPNLVGISGGGVHVYFRLKELVPVNKWKKLQEKYVKWFSMAFAGYGVDPVIKDPTRISRILGTYNVNKGAYSKVYLMNTNDYSYKYLDERVKNRGVLDRIKEFFA